MFHSIRYRVIVFLIVSIVAIGGFWFGAGPIPQVQTYYDFADQRPMLGMPFRRRAK